jgi:septum formation protein
MKLILASASPRRAEILRNAGIPFETHAADLDESRRPDELRADYVRRLALAKARAAASAHQDSSDCLFIGADTVVVASDQILGKPESPEDARRMLHLLSGAVHEVHTGLAVIRRPGAMEGIVEEITCVTFARLSDAEIESYIATGEPFDKAGAYGVQGFAKQFVVEVRGSYSNVVGLPLDEVAALLRRHLPAGVDTGA